MGVAYNAIFGFGAELDIDEIIDSYNDDDLEECEIIEDYLEELLESNKQYYYDIVGDSYSNDETYFILFNDDLRIDNYELMIHQIEDFKTFLKLNKIPIIDIGIVGGLRIS